MADLLVEISGDIKKLNDALNQANKKLDGFSNQTVKENEKVQKSFGSLGQFATGALAGIAAGFSVGAVVNFGKAVLDTTATFQKFGAVLSNTLGSDSDAQLALAQITKFASETPFAVDEITNAFVKLANQGFKPTIQELTALGDLAASTGKNFDQLAEAVLDAQVGEFERLKEFGIRAKVSGDNVTFTFKGVETQVKNTDDAIRGYVLSLGQAEGVSGAMAKISETVGGKISNLGDNIQQLQLAIGNQSEGVFATSIEWLSTFAEQATLVIKGIKEIKAEVKAVNFGEGINQATTAIDEYVASFSKIFPELSKQEIIVKAVNAVEESYRKLSSTQLANGNLTIGQLQETIVRIKEYGDNLTIAANKTDTLGKSTKSAFEIFSDQAKKDNESVFLQFAKETDVFNEELKDSIELQKALNQLTGNEGRNVGIPDFTDFSPGIAPIQEFADEVELLVGKTKLNIGELSGTFQGLGAAIGKAFGVKPAFGQFLGALIPFAAKLISTNFAIASSNAVAGASSASLATGPAAPFTLPGFIAASLGVVGAAFAAFGKGGGGGSFSGSGGSGVGVGQSSNFSGGSTAGNFDPNRNITLNGGFEISGDKLRYVLNQSEGFRN